MLTLEEKQFWSKLVHNLERLADAVENLNNKLDEHFNRNNSKDSEI